jgi:hypothetical protein
VDATGKTATLTDSADAAWKCDLRIDRPGEGLLNLGGQINGVEAAVRCTACRQKSYACSPRISTGCGPNI